MLHSLITRRTLRLGAALAALSFAVACDDDDDPTGAAEEPSIQSVRLSVTPPGITTPLVYTLSTTGSSPSPIQFGVGTTFVEAVALDDQGQEIDLGDEFEVRITGTENEDAPLPAGLDFSPDGLSGSLIADAAIATPTAVTVHMFHIEEDHSDFESNVSITVAP